MKSTGIVRKVDELGRIVLPIELRRTYDLAVKDAIELVSSAEAVKSALSTRARQFVQLVWQSSRVKLSNYIFVVIL